MCVANNAHIPNGLASVATNLKAMLNLGSYELYPTFSKLAKELMR